MNWNILEKNYNKDDYIKNETIFALANGFLGIRGSFDEGNIIGHDGTYINGFYELNDIKYGEKFKGYPSQGQTMVNVANTKRVNIFFDDEKFDLNTGEIIEYERNLDMREGILKREIKWRSSQGKIIRLIFERFVSFKEKGLIFYKYNIIPLNGSVKVSFESILDGGIRNYSNPDDPRVASTSETVFETIENKTLDDDLYIYQRTKRSKKEYGVYLKHRILKGDLTRKRYYSKDDSSSIIFDFNLRRNESVSIIRNAFYSLGGLNFKLFEYLKEKSEEAYENGYDYYLDYQKKYYSDFWNNCNVEIEGDDKLLQGIRFNMFHILNSTGKDGITNIAAKGLTGEGYEGHYFWDTETYILPFFIYTNPEIAKKLIEFRYNTLDKAKERALQMNHKKGALYPWRTINGYECSSYFPAGTAQYHINCDIAISIKRYFESTNDEDLLVKFGAEILFETSRLWMDTGFFIDGEFRINGVTGPDEYTAIINNNYYTNIMVSESLKFSVYVYNFLKKNYNKEFIKLINKIDLMEEEVEEWINASENMFLPYDKKLQINAQDDSFLSKPVWDLEKEKNFPLLLHYHPLVLYRYQVCKQADLILAEVLLNYKFDKKQIKKDYDYYEKITTHDSSLSTCIFSIAANYIGYLEKAYNYFMMTARTDLDNHHGNTKDGIHAANMAGTWLGLTMGFGGMKVYNDNIYFEPKVPKAWKKYSFKILYKSRRIKVEVDKQYIKYSLEKGDPVNIYHFNKHILLQSSYKLKNR
jgi:alpha,alpha-trehalose phosphorylase